MKILVALVICAITAAMAVGYGVATRPILADNQLYFFQTERCASGVPPHVSHMEVKTQLPSMIGGASIAAGRVFGVDDVHAGRAATLAAAVLATFFGWLLVVELALGSLAASRAAGATPATTNGALSRGTMPATTNGALSPGATLTDALPPGATPSTTTDALPPGATPATTSRTLPPVRSIGGLPLPAVAASFAGIAATFSIYGLFAEASSGFQPKVYMVAFLMATHLACAQRRYLLTGIAGMAAFLCWQPAGLVLASCGAALLVDRRTRWRSLFVTAGGALLALAAYESYFALTGGLAAQLHQEWRLAFGAPHKGKGAAESIWFFLTEAQTFRDRPNGLPSVYVAVLALAWLGALVRPRRTLEAIRERPGLVAFWLAAHIASAFTLYDHQAHPDMLLVQPYFAIACGIGASWVFVALGRVRGGAVITVVLAAVFVALGLSDAWRDVGRSLGGRTGLEQQRAMGRIVSMYVDHRGSVWALGSVHLLAFNRRDNWTNVGNVGHETSELDMKQYRPLRDGRMPEIIVSGRGLRPGGGGWLAAEYVDITPVPLAGARIRVFSRKSADQPGFTRTTAPKGAPGPKPTKPPAPRPAPAATSPPAQTPTPTPAPAR